MLINYGFSIENNPFDSFPFRLWTENIPLSENNKIEAEKMVFVNFLNDKEFESGKVEKVGLLVENLTNEFKLKKNKLSLDFLSFLRVFFA